jgi:hypothetical protein
VSHCVESFLDLRVEVSKEGFLVILGNAGLSKLAGIGLSESFSDKISNDRLLLLREGVIDVLDRLVFGVLQGVVGGHVVSFSRRFIGVSESFSNEVMNHNLLSTSQRVKDLLHVVVGVLKGFGRVALSVHKCRLEKVVNNDLLVIIQGSEDLLNRCVGVVFDDRFGAIFRMNKLSKRLLVEDVRLVLILDERIPVNEVNVLDNGARIGSGKHQTDLANIAVVNLSTAVYTTLIEIVGEDRESFDVLVLDHELGLLASFTRVEVSMTEYSECAVFENGMTEDGARVIVLMLPDERNLLLVHVRKGTRLDGSTVGALLVVDASPAAKVGHMVSHFEDLLSTVRSASVRA